MAQDVLAVAAIAGGEETMETKGNICLNKSAFHLTLGLCRIHAISVPDSRDWYLLTYKSLDSLEPWYLKNRLLHYHLICAIRQGSSSL